MKPRRASGVLLTMRIALPVLMFVAACGAPSHAQPVVQAPAGDDWPPQYVKPIDPPFPTPHYLAELESRPVPKLLAIDWNAVHLTGDADALALWQKIAPTGADWEQKLGEIPADLPLARTLAIAWLHAGNFTCAPPPHRCPRALLDVPEPAPTATATDPCLRRLIGLWSIAQLEVDDLPAVHDALVAIAAIPPPESELIAAALHAFPDNQQDQRMELIAAAWHAGQHELVESSLTDFDEPHLLVAATKLHIGAALAILPPAADRAAYLGAIDDEAMPRAERIQAIADLTADEEKLAIDSKAALVTAARGADCKVAAAAAHTLELAGDHRFVPRRPHTRDPGAMMHSLCVLAYYSELLTPDQKPLLPGYVSPRGLTIGYASTDAPRSVNRLANTDTDIPIPDELTRAVDHCTGTTCTSDSSRFDFGFETIGGELWLRSIDEASIPECHELVQIPTP